MWVGSLIIWFKPNWDVNNLSFELSVVLLSLEYQLVHLALKSPIKIVKKGLEKDTVSRLDSKLSKNVLNSSWFWLGDLYGKINLQVFFPIENSIFKHSWKHFWSQIKEQILKRTYVSQNSHFYAKLPLTACVTFLFAKFAYVIDV